MTESQMKGPDANDVPAEEFLQEHFHFGYATPYENIIYIPVINEAPPYTAEDVETFDKTGEPTESIRNAVNQLHQMLGDSGVEEYPATTVYENGIVLKFGEENAFQRSCEVLSTLLEAAPLQSVITEEKQLPPLQSRALSRITLENNFEMFPDEQRSAIALYPSDRDRMTEIAVEQVALYLEHLFTEQEIPYTGIHPDDKLRAIVIDMAKHPDHFSDAVGLMENALPKTRGWGLAN